ncbi:unnamed protein product [Albugo candida]|uniref:Uncharacterized protein n=1 Tax=Albugo candida TaxID=65357 RepID=A0A024GV44_9STRA|nr:unnamed protein product [Albugo candida]|eukprot:CCI50614.1 unnamed protein product [Albugo candida]
MDGHNTWDNLYEFNFKIQLWKKLETIGWIPPHRYRQSVVVFDDNMFIFGGVDKPKSTPMIYSEPLIVPLSLRVKCTCLVVTMEPTGCAIYIPLNLVSLPPCIDCQFLTICMQEYFVQCLWLNYMQLHTQTLQKNETIGSIQRLTSGHSFTANSS